MLHLFAQHDSCVVQSHFEDTLRENNEDSSVLFGFDKGFDESQDLLLQDMIHGYFVILF